MVAGKSPGWLPAGWKEQVKVTNGRKVKCYVEQLTGSKFYSKPQVSEYLKNKKPSTGELFGSNTSLKLEASDNTSSLEMSTLEGVSCLSKQKQIGVSKQSMKKVVIERTIPDGLPTGWIKETKIQKISGRKDPYYTDPVSGYVFRSVPDALRFLESGNINKCAIKPRKRDELIFLNEETSGEPPSAANMDHSGHHETKRQLEGSENSVTNKGLGKRQCPTVSADATILSTAEHLLNNATEECAETECSNDPTRSPLPRTEGSKRKLRDRVKANNGTDQLAVNAVGITSEQKMLIESTKTEKQGISLPRRSSKRLMVTNFELSERDLRAAARNAGGNEAKLLVCSAPQKLKTLSKAEIANHVSTGTEAPLDAKQSNRTNNPLKKEAFSEDWPARQGIDEEDEGNVESKILNPVGDSWSDPCLDFAVKILTGTIQIEEDTKESNDPGSSQLTRNDGCIRNQCEMVCAENGTVSFLSADMVQEGVLAENGMGMTRSRKMQINSRRSKKKEAVNLPRRSSIRLAGLNSNMAINLPLGQHVPASTKSGESGAAKPPPEALDNMAHSPQFFEPIEGSKKHMEDQAVQEHQPDRQETEKKTEGNPRSQFLYPLEDSWSDSCIEFAVKTLTGEIPIEDNTAIQDFFRQHDDTSHTLPDLGLPNYFQSDILLDFDSTGNPVSGTQLPEIPTFLSPGNVDLMGCGDNAPQQPSLGGKGEQQQTKGNS